MQPGQPEIARARALWQRSVNDYRAACDELKPRLKDGFAWLADATLHDGVVTDVDSADSNNIILVVDASNSPCGQTGTATFRFDDVRSASGLEDCIGHIWLFEEVHMFDDVCEICVLLPAGELRIAAGTLTVTCDT